MPRTVRLLTRARRYRRAVSAAASRAPGNPRLAPLPGALRLAVWRLTVAAGLAAVGMVWALACLIRGDPIGALLVAGLCGALARGIGGNMLDGPPS